MESITNLYKNATKGIVKFLEIEHNSPVKPENQYYDHTYYVKVKGTYIYNPAYEYNIAVTVSSAGIKCFSDCHYFYYKDDGNTLSLGIRNERDYSNLTISVEAADIGNVIFTQLSVVSGFTNIPLFSSNPMSETVYGILPGTHTEKFINSATTFYIATLSYNPVVITEKLGGKSTLIYGAKTYNLTHVTLTLQETVKDGGVDCYYIYKVTSSDNDTMIIH